MAKDNNKIGFKWSDYFDAQETFWLGAILIIAFLLRLVYVVEIQGTFFMNYLTDDSKIYNDWALKMLSTGDWAGDTPFFMAPAYPYILAVIYLIFGKSLFVVQIIQTIFSTVTIVFIYLAGRNFHSKAVGYTAAIIAAFYENFIFYSGAILSETFQTFFMALLIYKLSQRSENFKTKDYFIIGILTGIAGIFRGNTLLFALLMILYFLLKFLREKRTSEALFNRAGAFLGGVVLMLLPLTLHNYIAGKDFVLLTANGGINFYIGNNERSVGVFVTPREFDFYEDMPGIKYAQKILRRRLKPSEASSYWYGRGWAFIKNNPWKYLKLEYKKFLLFWGKDEDPQTSIMNPDFFAEHYSVVLQLPLFGFFFVSLLSIVGIFFSVKFKNNNPFFILLLGGFLLGNMLFFMNGRFRLAITPLLMIYAAFALVKGFELIEARKWKEFKTPALMIVTLIFLYYVSIDRPKFTPYDAYLHMGNKEYENKDYKKAIEFYKRSLFYSDYYMTYVNMGNAYAQLHDYKNAIAAYNLALKRKPDYYLTHFNLGFAFTQLSKWNKAIESYKLALQFKPDFADAYRNLGIVYYVNERYEDALYYFERYLELSDDEATKRSVREDIKNIHLKMKMREREGKK
jgi:tetratricopeptide (TPR) repeat protein